MKHIMLDIYGVTVDTEKMITVNEMMNKVITETKLKAVMPVRNLPYYYDDFSENGGITSFCILDNGHLTFHTFPFFGICYADIMFEDFDEEKVVSAFRELLKPEKIDYWCYDRDTEDCNADYSPETDFGPHVLASAVLEKKMGIGDIYFLLESMPEKIGMHPISRPAVITNKINNYNVISGIVIIAESHISFHINIETGKVYLDIYSCKFCDKDVMRSAVTEILGEDCKYALISRGEKHKNALKKGYTLTNNGWRSNI